ncbi:MAG: radical SAM/SPASM domain-containing protein [Oscillatoriales cyanobacterium]|nr:MAG: radical SAM/SPASM domain-containing protein [Oscillatoriales cyanobacterium]
MDRLNTLPRPFRDASLYEATLAAGFKTFPQRQENYLKYQAAQRGEVLDYLPVMLDIENVSRCNYHCTMCQVSDWEGFKRAEDMSFEDPLLGKCYFEMIEYARSKHIWVRSTTNASILHFQDNYRRLIDADICELQVSVDGTAKETYEKIRRGGRFEKVVENCRLLNEYCRDTNRKRTRMWTVVQQDNFSELEQFPVLAADLGFERLTLSLDVNDWGQDEWREVNQKVDVHRRFDLSMAERLIAIGKQHNVEVTFWFIDQKYDTTDPKKLCPWPFDRLYISSDMKIVPCCMVANPEVCELGDARNLTQEWNSEQMIAFRRAHLGGNIPKICTACYSNF